MAFICVNPTTGERIERYLEFSDQEIESRLKQAEGAFPEWKRLSFSERAHLMRKAGRILRERAIYFAQEMALEMGKPLKQGQAEAEKCAWVCDYYADHAERFLTPERVETDASKSYIAFEPLGIILAIMPWNFPFWQVFRTAAPALMAGNVVVLKHAANVTACALAIEKIFQEAGFPDGVFQTFLIGVENVFKLIAHPCVQAVAFTGSKQAGQVVASQAGSMIKKTVLELGGSDPYLILEDADVEKAASTCAHSRMINTGQSCVAAKRFIVVEKIAKEFENRLVEIMKGYTIGDPLKEGVTAGPLARRDLRDTLHKQVQESVSQGARLLLGGKIPEGPGAFYPPTVLSDVKKGMPAYEEETFGPVASVIRVKDEAEAVRVANDTTFGLGAAVFTQDLVRGERIARYELAAGCCFVNAYVKSDPRLPFGGIKASGYGRELSHFGIREFLNIKTVYLA